MKPEIVVYKTVDDTELTMHIFQPESDGNRCMIVMFFCGSWNGFDVTKCYPPATYFASRGAVCACAHVRVKPVHGTTPAECVIDAKSAVRWARQHASDYRVDPDKIVTYGSSAAGHVAASTALIDDFNDPQDPTNISAKPDACVLFCPPLVIYHTKRRVDLFGGPERARALSPIHHVTSGAPPMLIFHGEQDDVVVPEESVLFKRRMDEAGNSCRLIIHAGEGHAYHPWFDGNNAMFIVTHREVDRFLTSLGFLEGEPTINEFIYEPDTQ